MSIYTDGYEPSFHQNPVDDMDYLPEPEPWRWKFRDGSAIIVVDDDRARLELPHRKTSRLWMAEEVDNHIEMNELSAIEARDYIIKTYTHEN